MTRLASALAISVFLCGCTATANAVREANRYIHPFYCWPQPCQEETGGSGLEIECWGKFR